MTPRLLVCLTAAGLIAQDPPPIRVSTTLVQVDAVVTDREGRQVTNLTKDDFELFEDGKLRPITHFSYVRTGAPQPATNGRPQPVSAQRPVSPPQLEAIRRTIALLVDDLRMSFESVNHTRTALKKFVNEQMAEGDMVAIISTSGGVSSLQQFTTDKRVLNSAIDRVRFMLGGPGLGGPVKALGGAGTDYDPLLIAQVTNRRFAIGTLGAMKYVMEGMRGMPGRKSLVLFSDGLAMRPSARKQQPPVNVADVERVSDRANLSSVVVYAIDARGLPYFGIQAQDDVSGLDSYDVTGAIESREGKFRDEQEGLHFLAAQTGGLAQFRNNDINQSLVRMMEDQSGYYLLGFQPGEETSARINLEGKYHRLTVKVKRAGLRVRYRKGFMGGTGERRNEPQTPTERLLAALNSPFADSGVSVRITPMFAVSDTGEPSVRALLHISGNGLSFDASGSDGRRSAKVRVVSVIDGEESGSGVTEDTYTVRAKEEALEQLQQGGFVYAFERKVKRPGAYEMRIAVLDQVSGRVGSARRFIEVPDVRKGRLAISAITMCDCDWRVQDAAPSQQAQLSPAIRIFRHDQPFSYGVTLYNSPLDPSTGQPAVKLQPRLIRGDQVLWEGKAIPVISKPGDDPRSIVAGGSITLGRKTLPGEYLLELEAIHTDGRRTAVSQWIDFELR